MHMQRRAPARLRIDEKQRNLAAEIVALEAYCAALAGLRFLMAADHEHCSILGV
jgi:hypothetical protein